MKMVSIFFGGLALGLKAVVLLYSMMVVASFCRGLLLFAVIVFFGIANGFIDAKSFTAKITTACKVLLSIAACFATLMFLSLTLYINVPDSIAHHFAYGEGGKGLEAAGWLAFIAGAVLYFCTSLFVGFPIAMRIFAKRSKKYYLLSNTFRITG